MLASWKKIGDKVVAEKVVDSADAFTTATKEASQQVAQTHNTIVKRHDAIILHALSPDAINSAVKRAWDAGIVVVAFDGLVTEPCACGVTVDLSGTTGTEKVRKVAKRLPNGGNPIHMRGMTGTLIDDDITKGVTEEIAKHSILSTFNGDRDQTTAQMAVTDVLPPSPEIAGIIDQGGDGYGAAEAFRSVGRSLPIILLGNRKDEQVWRKDQMGKAGDGDIWSPLNNREWPLSLSGSQSRS